MITRVSVVVLIHPTHHDTRRALGLLKSDQLSAQPRSRLVVGARLAGCPRLNSDARWSIQVIQHRSVLIVLDLVRSAITSRIARRARSVPRRVPRTLRGQWLHWHQAARKYGMVADKRPCWTGPAGVSWSVWSGDGIS